MQQKITAAEPSVDDRSMRVLELLVALGAFASVVALTVVR